MAMLNAHHPTAGFCRRSSAGSATVSPPTRHSRGRLTTKGGTAKLPVNTGIKKDLRAISSHHRRSASHHRSEG